jgi:ATP-dependent Clp protease ATP-binding subunit ClpA
MFERFTRGARRVIELAQIEARELGHSWVGTEHLILALADEDFGVTTEVLREAGIDSFTFKAALEAELGTGEEGRARDAEALRTIGIDLDEVQRRIEDAFGPGSLDPPAMECKRSVRWGHIPFTPKSKRALELSLREALRLGHKYIGCEHILLGVLRDRSSTASRLIEELVGSADDLRDRLVAALRRAS